MLLADIIHVHTSGVSSSGIHKRLRRDGELRADTVEAEFEQRGRRVIFAPLG